MVGLSPDSHNAPLASFQTPTHLYFGPGAVGRVGEIAQKLEVSRVLVVTDAGVTRAGIVGHVTNALGRAGVEYALFDTVEPSPATGTAQEAARLYGSRGCGAIVAVGGGSVLDAAKAAGVLATNPGSITSYIGFGRIVSPLPPMIMVPTTGSGSEVTNFAVLADPRQRKKVQIGGPLMAPDFALLDPGLAVTLSPVALGMSALGSLTQAIESVLSVLASPFSDGLALEAIHAVAANLPAAVDTPALETRARLLYAGTLAGLALNHARLGLAQAMAHALTAYYGVPHDMAVAVLLPNVMAFNAREAPSALRRVAIAMGEHGGADEALAAVRRLGESAGAPTLLSALGVTREYVPQMVKDVLDTPGAQVVNPRHPSAEELTDLFLGAL